MTLLLDSVDRSSIVQLNFSLSVNGGAAKKLTVTPMQQLPNSTTILFRPDPAPAQAYLVSLVVEAVNAAGEVLAIGSAPGRVSSNGCNRIDIRLTTLPATDAGPPGSDLSVAPDLSRAPDLSSDGGGSGGSDMPVCSGGTPDEDADGRADFCDVCAADADPTPVDSDGDGVPDACDPDQAQSGNQVLYFEPFNVDSGHWSAPFMVVGGSLNGTANPMQSQFSTNAVDVIPSGAMVETYMTAPFLQGTGGASAGIFLGDQATENGAACAITYKPSGTDTLDLDTVANGVITATSSSALPFGNDVVYRMRLTQRGTHYTCEGIAMVTPGPPPATATATITNGAATPHYMALRIINLEAHFLNVFAVTAQ